MSLNETLKGGREVDENGEWCKFAIGDQVRKKGTEEPIMTVTIAWRHPDEHELIEIQCEYEHDGLTSSQRYRIDDLELVEKIDP